MIWFLAGLVLLLQIYFWGVGLTLLILPRRWRAFWPFCAGAAGLGLQSAIVWFAAHTALPGTDSYAAVSTLIPIGLLGAAIRRQGVGVLTHARKWWGLGLVMALALGLQSAPFAARSRSLTSAALSSCDAADYVGGARVFKEFSSRDRSGFMGVPEAVSTLSVDNFYDFWLRLNHFTPSALIAFNATLFGRQSYELASLFATVLLTLNLPGVFWLARSAFRFGPRASLAAAAIYGCSPIVTYAAGQTALGQLLGALAVALICWTGWQAFRAAHSWRALAGYAGLLLLGDWLLLGSYNFFVVFAYVPLLGYGTAQALWRREARPALRWAGWLALVFVASACLFPERVLGLAERFYIFNKTPFGWPIAGFWPDGWYGSFRNVRLEANGSILSLGLAAVCLGALVWVWSREASRRSGRAWFAAACLVPILLGYALLLAKDARYHDNASYDAFKLFAVFYPATLLAFCLWLRVPPGARPLHRIGVAALWLAVLSVNLTGTLRFILPMSRTALTVRPTLAALSTVERMPEVTSLNVCLQSNWDVLWANSFLLHKPQYFPVTEYEARHGSALKGEWDLREHFMDVVPSAVKDWREISEKFYLVNRRSPEFAELQRSAGWYVAEHDDRQMWCWSSGSPQMTFSNPQAKTLRGVLSFSARSPAPRQVTLRVGRDALWVGTINPTLGTVDNVPVEFPPGQTRLRFDTAQPPTAVAGDGRALTFALYGLQVHLQGPLPPLRIGQTSTAAPTLLAYGVPH